MLKRMLRFLLRQFPWVSAHERADGSCLLLAMETTFSPSEPPDFCSVEASSGIFLFRVS